MRPPCEIVVRYVLPAFRALVAKELMENHNFSQSSAAKILGIKQPAISQYLRSKRGIKVTELLKNIPFVMSTVSSLAREIEKGNLSSEEMIFRFCELCRVLITNHLLCELHKEHTPSLENCYGACSSTKIC